MYNYSSYRTHNASGQPQSPRFYQRQGYPKMPIDARAFSDETRSIPVQPVGTSRSNNYAVHMPEQRLNSISRNRAGGHLNHLNEPGQPNRPSFKPDPQFLTKIINWLDVEKSARYKNIPGKTYCIDYAYDYAYLAGVYLPRVWWTPLPLSPTRKQPPPSSQALRRRSLAAKDIGEMNANNLFLWFIQHGNKFGWQDITPTNGDFTKAQQAANDGYVVMVSKRRPGEPHGHIAVIVPETAVQKAIRRPNGSVSHPLQSQAGGTVVKYRNIQIHTNNFT